MENNEVENKFRNLIGKSIHEVPDRNFENKVMEKVLFMNAMKQKQRKNLKLSWFFLILSTLLFPMVFITFSDSLSYEFLKNLGANIQSPEHIFLPAMILIFAIVILLQIDNLLQLTFKPKMI